MSGTHAFVSMISGNSVNITNILKSHKCINIKNRVKMMKVNKNFEIGIWMELSRAEKAKA